MKRKLTYPAAMAGFVVALESGDTLIHKQMVVRLDKDLYYLNNTFDWHDDGSLELLGDSIISTIRFHKCISTPLENPIFQNVPESSLKNKNLNYIPNK